jgi:hypothetical protein
MSTKVAVNGCLYCIDDSGVIDNNPKNHKMCKDFASDLSWELPGLQKWIYVGEENILLFVDYQGREEQKLDPSFDIESDVYWPRHDSIDHYDEEELGPQPTYREWYDQNSGIDQLFTTRLGNPDILGEDYISWSDDDKPLIRLVEIFGELVIMYVQTQEEYGEVTEGPAYEFRCTKEEIIVTPKE